MSEKFNLEPKEIPTRHTRTSKYRATVDAFLESKAKSSVVHLEDAAINSAYSGFSRIIKSGYSDKVSLGRVAGELYIERI